MTRSMAFAAGLSAALLAACGTELPVEGANVSPSTPGGLETARLLYGEDQETRQIPLAGAMGLTLAHQEAIDRATDAGCASGAFTQVECRRASTASAQRRLQLLN